MFDIDCVMIIFREFLKNNKKKYLNSIISFYNRPDPVQDLDRYRRPTAFGIKGILLNKYTKHSYFCSNIFNYWYSINYFLYIFWIPLERVLDVKYFCIFVHGGYFQNSMRFVELGLLFYSELCFVDVQHSEFFNRKCQIVFRKFNFFNSFLTVLFITITINVLWRFGM